MDRFQGQHNILSAPTKFKTPAKSDTVDLPETCYCIWVTGAGDIKIDSPGGSTGTFAVLVTNEWQSFAARRIYSTGTTATFLIGY